MRQRVFARYTPSLFDVCFDMSHRASPIISDSNIWKIYRRFALCLYDLTDVI